ncbi:Mu transposase-like protein [Curtobacterium sp. PhB142]|uniref:Mu transposase C-terminal domain-containing protein n=1 Tax=unclassified Curtobacterium TaxID=257496 RepID=UPI001048C276|nr:MULTISPECIES: Mu transposase C-terminal domain-containing protein [unclassified Curtobacterium]TCL88763.1 Mu transposase-like protein [Curtobacterium sp. PhB142]TCM03874.1 Mu transposase-like protein [Curtobacterium sp. PhB134]
MAKSTHTLRVGAKLRWDGEDVVIARLGATVLLKTPLGERLGEVPFGEVSAAARGGRASPDAPKLHDVEARLSKSALDRLHRDQDLLRVLNTGLHADAPPHAVPPPYLDPEQRPVGRRATAVAAEIAAQTQTAGLRNGGRIKHKSAMRRLQRLRERYGDGNGSGLVDKRLLRPSTHRTPEPVITELCAYIDKHNLKSSVSNAAIVRGFLAFCLLEKLVLPMPHSSTLRKRVAELRAAFPDLGANAKNRVSASNVPEISDVQRLATRVGELVLFDTTKSNVWVTDPRTKRKARLDITLALDLATRAIVGLAVTADTPQFAIGLCVADVLRPKTAELAETWTSPGDFSLQQISVGSPHEISPFYSQAFHPEGAVADNGRPYVSMYTTGIMAEAGIHYEPQRSYTPTDKAQIERVFRTIKDMFEALMPGFTGGSVYEQGEDPAADARMTPLEYERRLRQCIDIYNHRTHTGLVVPGDPFERLSPFMMWGLLLSEQGWVPDVSWEHEWIKLLPSEARTIRTGNRIRAARLDYKSRDLKALRGDPDVMRTGKLRIHYDPYDLRRAYCFDSAGTLHILHWQYLTRHTEQFGIMHTNWVVEQYADKRLSNNDIDRLIAEVMAGAHDEPGRLERMRHVDLIDDLVVLQAARLTSPEAGVPVLEAPERAASSRQALPVARPSETIGGSTTRPFAGSDSSGGMNAADTPTTGTKSGPARRALRSFTLPGGAE